MRLTVAQEDAGARLDRYLAERIARCSRAVIMKYLKEGHGRVNGRRCRPGDRLRPGDVIDLPDFREHTDRIRGGEAPGLPEAAYERPQPDGILILYEDEHLIVVDKPPGLVMHPGKGHPDEGLDRILADHFGPSARLVHRLDRDTSGVVVVARGHPRSARRLAAAFAEGDVQKTYVALVQGVPIPPRGIIDARLLDRREVGTKVQVAHEGRTARTDYETVDVYDKAALVRCFPKTGRRHQIRVHLAHIRHPLLVDPQYAGRKRIRLSNLRPELPLSWKNPWVLSRTPLHAAAITLRHPQSGEDVTFEAPLPDDMKRVIAILEESE